jgi:mono/diheme cytochrome c family protein
MIFNFRKNVLATTLFVVGCAVGPEAGRPDAADARRAAARWPGTTVDDLEHGRAVYVARCSGCHALPEPSAKAPEQWPTVLGEMAARAHLSDEDRDFVTRYLTVESERETKAHVALRSSAVRPL